MKLYPKNKPYQHGFLEVSGGHSLYYELCGNPKGRPVLFVHGGPGAGCSADSRRFFNLRKFHVILFDQRGAGRSKPYASMEHNTTPDLVSDMKQLLSFLGIKKVFLFGGSWGSTLSLAYAVKYPATVTGMLLRGIFLGSKEEINYTFGGGAQDFFPESWERFSMQVPASWRYNIATYYLQKMRSRNEKIADYYAKEWARYELSMLKLDMSERELEKMLGEYNYRSLGALEAYYLVNKCFMPKDHIIKNAKKLKMPVTIVHGRYDCITPPSAAYRLHKALKQSKLRFIISGHGSSDPVMQSALVEEMKRMRYQKRVR